MVIATPLELPCWFSFVTGMVLMWTTDNLFNQGVMLAVSSREHTNFIFLVLHYISVNKESTNVECILTSETYNLKLETSRTVSRETFEHAQLPAVVKADSALKLQPGDFM